MLLNKFFEGSCELLRFDADKLLHFHTNNNKWNVHGQNIMK